MAQSTDVAGGESVQREETREGEFPLTLRVLGYGMVGGLLGMLVMLPLLVGVPVALGVFRAEPIARFVPLVEYFGIRPTFAMGIGLFIAGGTVLLPMVFVVVGAYLPPERPRFLRGATFATIFWTGFVLAFWPGGTTVTIATFLVVSLIAHWVYGTVLAGFMDRTVGIPQHDV